MTYGYILAALWGLAACIVVSFALSTPARGVEITPAACYAMVGTSEPAAGRTSALILNTCTGAFKWVRIPRPPESEV